MQQTHGTRPPSVLERLGGALLVGTLLAYMAGVAAGPGIDTREPYFRDSLSEASRDLERLALQAGLVFAAGLAFLAMSVVLAGALRPLGRGIALTVAGAMAFAGIVLLGYAALAVAVHQLASAWGDSSFLDIALLGPARDIEEIRQTLGMASVLGPLVSAGALGWTAIRGTSRIPRWLGLSGGALIACIVATIALNTWAGVMLTLLGSLAYLVIVAVFMLSRGIAPAERSAP